MAHPVVVGGAALLCALGSATAVAANVVCHVNYGGEDRAIVAPPVSSPYGVKGIEVGSYFLFRVVNQTTPPDLASVKVYTYANHDAGAAPIHQAQFSLAEVARRLPKAAKTANGDAASHGFTGLHWVYEPVRDGELRYWCELAPPAKPLKGQP